MNQLTTAERRLYFPSKREFDKAPLPVAASPLLVTYNTSRSKQTQREKKYGISTSTS